jgi:HAMP domain-containing protein
VTEFVVKIIAKPSVSDEVLKLLLARAFNTSPEKFDSMLEHQPPVIVARKPSEGEARAMALKFESLGFQLEVFERQVQIQSPAIPRPEPVAPPKQSQTVQQGRKNPTVALGKKPVAVDNLGEGVLALPSKRAIRWPTMPVLTLSRTPTPEKTGQETNPRDKVGSPRDKVGSPRDKAATHKPTQMPLVGQPQSLPTQVVEPDRTDTLVDRTPRRLSLQSRVFLAGALPMLLSIILVGLILQQAVPPMLDNLVQRTARTSAITLATAAEPLLGPEMGAQLEQLFQNAQPKLKEQGIKFAFLTDTLGNPAKGWAEGDPNNLPPELKQAFSSKAQQLVAQNSSAVSEVVVLPDQTLAIAAAPLSSQGAMVGTLVVGIEAMGFAEGFQEVLRNVLLAGLLPVFLAILGALLVTRAISRVIMQLTRAADRIGMGDLSTEIGVRTGDELELLSHAMNRMRLGLQKHLDRQNRR